MDEIGGRLELRIFVDVILQPGVERLGRRILLDHLGQLDAKSEERKQKSQSAVGKHGQKVRQRRLLECEGGGGREEG